MNGQGCKQSTSFPEDSLVSRSVQPGSAGARMMTVTSGRRCSELLKNFSPLGLLAKMLLESSTWHSTQCLLTWKTKATKQGRLYFQLAASTPRTSETGLQSWPTPAARDCKGANSMGHLQREGKRNHADQLANAVKMWPTPTSRSGTGPSQTETRQGGMDLQTAARLYPTPTQFDATCGDIKGKEYNGQTQHAMKLIQAAKLHPTPTTGAGLCGGTGNYQQLKALEADGAISEEERRSMAAGNGGQLNPVWVEAMMGFPIGWTRSEPDGRTEAGNSESPA